MDKLLITLISILVFNTCNNNPVSTDTLQPGRRDYVWSVDTIPVVYSVMKDMWGSSPTDIWVCGDGFDRRQSLWHYDGKRLKPYNEYILSATSIFGFSKNNIWMGTAIGQIWHYNGVSWQKDTTLEMSGYNDIIIQDIKGTGPTDMYAIGMANSLDDYRGIIAHYDGKIWKYLDIPYFRVNFGFMYYDNPSTSYLLYAANFDNVGTSERVYILKNKVLKELWASDRALYPDKIADKVFLYGQKKIYSLNQSSFDLFLDLSNTNFLGRLMGRTTKDFFCNTISTLNDSAGIGHWNGTNLVTIFPTDILAMRCLFFDTEVIFLAHSSDSDINALIKGKLPIK
jgi:hypothetical protein